MTTNNIVNAQGSASGQAHLSARGRRKHHLSQQHLKTARYFTGESAEIEKTRHLGIEEDVRVKHRAYVTGAVISSVAFLETSINEFYLEAQDKNKNSLPGLDDQVLSLLVGLWEELERKPILHKYQIALLVAGAEQFERGKPPYQDADNLIKLRDALIHYKPQWDDEDGPHRNLEERLQSRFPLNPLSQSGSLWFPHQCLGSGCATWGVEMATLFNNQFCERLKIPLRTD